MQATQIRSMQLSAQCVNSRHNRIVTTKISSSVRLTSRSPARLHPCRSTDQQDEAPTTSEQPSTAAPEQPSQQQPAEVTSGKGLKEGQLTAIITGGISLFVAILYLLLVVAMDIRGGELLPPPPEAYIP